MPIKMMVMVKRRPDLTPEQFRDGYESSHAPLAVKLFGHLWLEYRRNYLKTGRHFGQEHGGAFGPDGIGYDALSEFVLPDEAALAEMGRVAAENRAMIHEDEKRWFDRRLCWSVAVETIEEEQEAHRRRRGEAG